MALRQMIPVGWNIVREGVLWGIWMRGLGRHSERNEAVAVEKSHSWKDGSVSRPSRAMERLLELLSGPDDFWLGPYVLSRGSKSLQAASQKALKLIPKHLPL